MRRNSKQTTTYLCRNSGYHCPWSVAFSSRQVCFARISITSHRRANMASIRSLLVGLGRLYALNTMDSTYLGRALSWLRYLHCVLAVSQLSDRCISHVCCLCKCKSPLATSIALKSMQAVAANTIMRSLFGAIFPLFATCKQTEGYFQSPRNR